MVAVAVSDNALPDTMSRRLGKRQYGDNRNGHQQGYCNSTQHGVTPSGLSHRFADNFLDRGNARANLVQSRLAQRNHAVFNRFLP